jgi:uncharacterized protein YciI
MILINLEYKAILDVIDEHLENHRAFLRTGYEQGVLVSSGPKIPRTGGIILGNFSNLQDAKEFMSHDPFVQNGLVDIEYVEYNEVMSALDMSTK